MRKPNLFIVGAPKCGTTSLAAWLSAHPQVHFSRIKEPHFFNFDFANRRYRDIGEYEKLFEQATDDHKIVAEASVRYLFSRTAVPAILRYSPDAKFIVMIRSPIEMAPSLHDNNLFNGHETVADFEVAWRLQEQRMFGSHVPRQCADPQLLWYGPLCQIGLQVKRLFEVVPRERVLVIDLHRLREDPSAEYTRVLRFLLLHPDNRTSFPVLNAGRRRRFKTIWRLTTHANRIYQALGLPNLRLGVIDFLNRRARAPKERKYLGPGMREELVQYFQQDIALLESELQSSFAHFFAKTSA